MQLALINKKMNKLIKGHFRKYATNAFIFRVVRQEVLVHTVCHLRFRYHDCVSQAFKIKYLTKVKLCETHKN